MTRYRQTRSAAQFTIVAALATSSVVVAGQADAAPVIATPYGCNSQVTVKAGYNGECARAVQWTMNEWISRTAQKITPLVISGSFDAATTAAVMKFQAANGLVANGVIDAKSWPALINEASMPSGVTPATPPAVPVTPVTSPVSRATTYPITNVRKTASTSASIVGTLTAGTAITGMLSNGWVKVATPTQYAGAYISDSVLKPTTAATTAPVTPVTTPAQPIGPLKTPFGCNTRYTLNLGTDGECVKSVAYVLNSWSMKSGASFAILPTDGAFTVALQTELKAFQKAQGISQTGSVDTATWAVIEKVSQGSATAPKLTIPAATKLDHQAFPGAVKLADGRLMAIVRGATSHLPSGANATTLWGAYSPDNGYTWTTPEEVNIAVPGVPAGAVVSYTDPSLSVPKTGSLVGRPILTFFTYTFSSASATFNTENVPAQAWISVASDKAGSSWGTPQPLNFAGPGTNYMSSAAVQLDGDHFITAGYGPVLVTGAASQSMLAALSIGMLWDGKEFANSLPGLMSNPLAGYNMDEPNILPRGMDGFSALSELTRTAPCPRPEISRMFTKRIPAIRARHGALRFRLLRAQVTRT